MDRVVVTHKKQIHWLLKRQERLCCTLYNTTCTSCSWLSIPTQKHTKITSWFFFQMSFKTILTFSQVFIILHKLPGMFAFPQILYTICMCYRYVQFSALSLNESSLEYEKVMLFELILNFNYKTKIYYISRNSEMKRSTICLFCTISACCVKLLIKQWLENLIYLFL